LKEGEMNERHTLAGKMVERKEMRRMRLKKSNKKRKHSDGVKKDKPNY